MEMVLGGWKIPCQEEEEGKEGQEEEVIHQFTLLYLN
jgi:hypothetical protein